MRMVRMDGWYRPNRTVIPLLSFVYFEISMLLHGLTIPPTDKPPNLGKGFEGCDVWGSLACEKWSDD